MTTINIHHPEVGKPSFLFSEYGEQPVITISLDAVDIYLFKHEAEALCNVLTKALQNLPNPSQSSSSVPQVEEKQL